MATPHTHARENDPVIAQQPPVVLDIGEQPSGTRWSTSERFGRLLSPFRQRHRSHHEDAADTPGAAQRAAPFRALDHQQDLALLKLVQRLFLPVGQSSDGYRSVVFASPSATADDVAATTAETLAAHTGRRVCLVDASLRDAALHRRYALDNSVGWFDVLTGSCTASEAAVSISPKLWVIPAGPRRPDRVPSIDHLRGGVASLLSRFDFVLYSGNTLDPDIDVAQLATLVDGLIVVLTPTSRRDDTSRFLDHLRGARARVLGAVIRSGTNTLHQGEV